MLFARPPTPTVAPKYEKIRDVPLDYRGHESTLVVNCGAAEMRVVIDQWVRESMLREYCEQRRGWRIAADADLFVTDAAGVQYRYPAKKVAGVVINPTATRVEWQRRMGEKG